MSAPTIGATHGLVTHVLCLRESAPASTRREMAYPQRGGLGYCRELRSARSESADVRSRNDWKATGSATAARRVLRGSVTSRPFSRRLKLTDASPAIAACNIAVAVGNP